MDYNFEITEKPTPPKNRCIISGSAIEEKYKIFINYLAIAKAMKHGLKDTINEMGGLLIGNIYSDKRIDDDFIYLDIKTILPISRIGLHKKFTFSEEELEKLKEEAKEKFPEDNIVGWYHSHPGWGVELSEDDHETHMNFFNAEQYVLLIVESVAKDFAIFGTDKAGEKAYPTRGYVIYCDTNDDIPKMKKLVDMVEQNRERKKDKEIKPEIKIEEIEKEETDSTDEENLYLSLTHPRIIITILSSIIIVLLIVLAVGKTKMDNLRKKALYNQGSFTIETREPEKGKREIFIDFDFINETLKIIAIEDKEEQKWRIEEIYIKEGSFPFQLIARLAAPTPSPVSLEETPAEYTSPVTEPITETPVVKAPAETAITVVDATPTTGETSISIADNSAVKDNVNAWIHAWKSGDIEKFRGFYSEDFKNSRCNNLEDWMENRVFEKIFEGNPQVDIVGEIEVTPINSNEITVKFEQYFNGSFVTNGYKTLKFTRENKKWLITEEEFELK
ncbi:MAG TPA: Mov34/MPN/PAD-1 family protein [Candidatus Eremiobacteraeota bacterium]|nr:MAG: Mov34/MPN/PAD-1 family protein [bacterium ADurb.Bin363]HPZ06485.1 Mov34/MPN/PAD-1 family protein [Candidatus Eremiobacteraeota bacterium]